MIGTSSLWTTVKVSARGRDILRRVRAFPTVPWSFEEIVILRKTVLPVVASHTIAVREYGGDIQRIADLYAAMERSISEERIRQRLANGLKLYEATAGGQPIATTWLVLPGRRFIDEIGYHLIVPDNSLWIRDIYVAPRARGRRMFSSFLDQILCTYYPAVRELWSDTTADNHGSLKAHTGYGFQFVESLKVLHLARLLMIRSAPPNQAGCAGGFKPESRVLVTGRGYQAYKAAYLA